MPIDFNQQTFFDPKIDIIGKEVPLAEIEKTGNVLQNRFDKSYEQYSAADEALKQMEARANPVDREKAKELRSIYKEEMDKILEQGDFHNMRRQTENLARNAAINYKVIEEKNAAIQKGLDEIAKSPKYQLDPEGAKQDYLKSLQSINFNPETRTISDFNVGTYNAAEDQNIAQMFLKIAPSIRTKTKGNKDAFFTTIKINGQDALVKKSQTGEIERLTSKEIQDELQQYIVTDPAIQAYIKRDVKRMGIDPESKEGLAAYNSLMNERVTNAAKAAGDMYEVDKDTRKNDVTPYLNEGKSLGIGVPPPPQGGNYSPADVFQEYKKSDGDFKYMTFGALQGNKATKTMLMGTLDAMSNTNPKAKEAKRAVKELLEFTEKYPQYADNISKVTAGQTNLPVLGAAQGIYNILNLGFNLISDAVKGNSTEQMRKDFMKVKESYHKVASMDFIDSEFEDQFQQFSKSTPLTRTLPLVEFDITNDNVRNMLDNLGNKFTINDFEIIEGGEWEDKNKNIKFQRWSEEAYGNGIATVYEIKDSNGNTFLVHPKKQSVTDGLNSQIAKANPQSNIVSSYIYKDITPPMYNNTVKSYGDFAEEINSPELQGVKKVLLNNKDMKISFVDGMYTLIDVSGKPVGPPQTSVYKLLPRP
jgi:hypothetical protein